MTRTTSIAACTMLIALGAPSAAAQQAKAPAAAAPPGELVRRAKPTPPQQRGTPVLSEGTFLASVPGYFAASPREPGLLTFRIDERQVSSVRRALYVMPSDPTWISREP